MARCLISVRSSDPQPITIVLPGTECGQIRGRLQNAEGEGVSGVTVSMGDGLRGAPSARTLRDGYFELALLSEGAHRLNAEIEGCRFYYATDAATLYQWQAAQVELSPGGLVKLAWDVPAGMCAYRVQGRLLDANGVGVTGTRVSASISDQSVPTSQSPTGTDGSFEIVLPAVGSYRISTKVNGCSVSYLAGSATAHPDRAALVPLTDRDVTGLRFGVYDDSDELCEYRIFGEVAQCGRHAPSRRADNGIGQCQFQLCH